MVPGLSSPGLTPLTDIGLCLLQFLLEVRSNHRVSCEELVEAGGHLLLLVLQVFPYSGLLSRNVRFALIGQISVR
jgi:hypothetical protein